MNLGDEKTTIKKNNHPTDQVLSEMGKSVDVPNSHEFEFVKLLMA